ncbi:MAG: CoB--CoM heterodisulfide reductase iron-sulfur subunit B family protein [Chloroflexi bacterium]|nr:CoB--CoM heterodisulfide reductase iron-sulfur subunit B family protein [Chloroflexota bacterium]
MKYAYYPGCSSHSTARDMHESAIAVARKLGIELVEIEGWSCCGATAAHQTDRVLAASLPAANMLLAKQMGLDTVVTCAACYNRMKVTNYEVSSSPAMRARVADVVGQPYDGSVAVRHLVEVLLRDIGIEKLHKSFTHSLGGLKVAAYYGCLLVRPHDVTHFDDAENPTVLDRLVDAMGGQSVDWPGKVDCCGGGLNLTRTDMVVKLSGSIIDMAKESGAGCITVACPMCQASLDLRQKDMQKQTGRRYEMPIVYITQLLGLCLGIPRKELGLNRLMVSPASVLQSLASKA